MGGSINGSIWVPDLIVMGGSPSDKKYFVQAKLLDTLQELKISWELSYVSAHRNPEELISYLKQKYNLGAKLLLAAATLAAAIGGAAAAAVEAKIPTLGVPILAEDGFSGGHDALYAMLRMPPGIPVLVPGFGITGLKLAAIAAAQILGLANPEIKKALARYLADNHKAPRFNVVNSTNYIKVEFEAEERKS